MCHPWHRSQFTVLQRRMNINKFLEASGLGGRERPGRTHTWPRGPLIRNARIMSRPRELLVGEFVFVILLVILRWFGKDSNDSS